MCVCGRGHTGTNGNSVLLGISLNTRLIRGLGTCDLICLGRLWRSLFAASVADERMSERKKKRSSDLLNISELMLFFLFN